jgi:hypothetical protein
MSLSAATHGRHKVACMAISNRVQHKNTSVISPDSQLCQSGPCLQRMQRVPFRGLGTSCRPIASENACCQAICTSHVALDLYETKTFVIPEQSTAVLTALDTPQESSCHAPYTRPERKPVSPECTPVRRISSNLCCLF